MENFIDIVGEGLGAIIVVVEFVVVIGESL